MVEQLPFRDRQSYSNYKVERQFREDVFYHFHAKNITLAYSNPNDKFKYSCAISDKDREVLKTASDDEVSKLV